MGSTTRAGGTDYTTLSGSVTILAGDTTADIDVTGIVDDTIVEADETVIVQLNSISSGDPQISIGAGDTATVTILNNDQASLSIGDVSLFEGNAGTTAFTFTVTSSNEASEDITVVVNTCDLTATGGGVDYADVVNQTVTIFAGNTSATATVDVTGPLDSPEFRPVATSLATTAGKAIYENFKRLGGMFLMPVLKKREGEKDLCAVALGPRPRRAPPPVEMVQPDS